MAKDWTRHNEQLFERILQAGVKDIEVRIKMVLSSFAYKIYDMISSTTKNEGDGFLPYYTGNLRDSTGVGLYYEGSLIKFIPPKSATRKQNGFWGSTFIERALQGTSHYSSGLWVVVWSTVPYAVKIDEMGTKHWNAGWFSERLVEETFIPQFKAIFSRMFPELASQINK